ncbi:MAG: hypothetical protein V3U92_19545 [Cellulophaga sp.]
MKPYITFGKRVEELAEGLHRKEHVKIQGREPDHKPEYYFRMQAWTYLQIMDKLEAIEKRMKRKKRKHKLSEWQKFSSEKMKEGLSMTQVATEWKELKIARGKE